MDEITRGLAEKLYSIAREGLTYSTDKFDLDRYNRLLAISLEILSHSTGVSNEKITEAFRFENGYNTPKVDVRGVIFKEGKILLVKENSDGGWTLPGGWADWGFTPSESVVKEVSEEAGLAVRVTRLLAVLDKRNHPHPPDLFCIYKLFFACEIIGTVEKSNLETGDVAYFAPDEIPKLSTGRTTASQIHLMFEFYKNSLKETLFD